MTVDFNLIKMRHTIAINTDSQKLYYKTFLYNKKKAKCIKWSYSALKRYETIVCTRIQDSAPLIGHYTLQIRNWVGSKN